MAISAQIHYVMLLRRLSAYMGQQLGCGGVVVSHGDEMEVAGSSLLEASFCHIISPIGWSGQVDQYGTRLSGAVVFDWLVLSVGSGGTR
jgi:hypothetical protein